MGWIRGSRWNPPRRSPSRLVDRFGKLPPTDAVPQVTLHRTSGSNMDTSDAEVGDIIFLCAATTGNPTVSGESWVDLDRRDSGTIAATIAWLQFGNTPPASVSWSPGVPNVMLLFKPATGYSLDTPVDPDDGEGAQNNSNAGGSAVFNGGNQFPDTPAYDAGTMLVIARAFPVDFGGVAITHAPFPDAFVNGVNGRQSDFGGETAWAQAQATTEAGTFAQGNTTIDPAHGSQISGIVSGTLMLRQTAD